MSNVAPIPTLDEIHEQLQLIQAGWTVKQERQRRGMGAQPRPYTFPRLAVEHRGTTTLFKPDGTTP